MNELLDFCFAKIFSRKYLFSDSWRQPPNGMRYRQGRDVAGKTARRRIRLRSRLPESAANGPHLSGAYHPGALTGRGVGRRLL